jgi:uncharacterized surface protein with fasciclin (FAS1) repeats
MTDRFNLIETIAQQDRFSTFTRLMASSGANDVFNGEGPFTAFVPTNDAFAKIPTIIMNELLNEPAQVQLKGLLSYHIISGKVMAASLGTVPTRTSVRGQELRFSDSNGLKVNGAIVEARNIEATNGVIHSLATVLAPSKTTAPVKAATAVAGAEMTQAVPLPPPTPSTSGSVTATETPEPASSDTSPADSVPASKSATKPIF